MKRFVLRAATLLCVGLACVSCGPNAAETTSQPDRAWVLVDDFEAAPSLKAWTNLDVQNETNPFVPDPQITELRREETIGNHYLLRKPAADGVVGNRKAISFRPLPRPIPVGETYTLHTRIQVESFPNNHSFGLSNIAASDIGAQHYDAFEPMIRVTDKAESNGEKNDGTLMVLSGYKTYSKIVSPVTKAAAKPLEPGTWYSLWYVVNNASQAAGGQSYDLYVRGGEFQTQQLVFSGATFRMQREAPLGFFMTICNTGPHKVPYGNGGVGYDDIYMAEGRVLSSPLDN